MKMKKFMLTLSLSIILLSVVCLFGTAVTSFAEENVINDSMTDESTADDLSSYQQEIDDYAGEISGQLEGAYDDDAQSVLDEYDISVKDPGRVSDISISSVFEKIEDMFADAVQAPLVMLGEITAVVLLCSVAQSIAPNGDELVQALKVMIVMSAAVIMYDSIFDSIKTVQTAVQKLSDFMISYVPIFSSVTAASGSVTASGSYYAMTLIACEAVGSIAKNIVMPFLSIVLALSISTVAAPQMQLTSAAESIKKACQWVLGAAASLFVGLLSIQGFSGNAADSLAARGAKFVASSFIPIVGGAVSEAYSAIYSSLGLIRTSVGTIGIIVIAVIVIRPIVSIIALRAAVTIAGVVCGIFGQDECSSLMKSVNAVLSIGMSVLICFSLVFIISTAVVMMSAMNLSI